MKKLLLSVTALFFILSGFAVNSIPSYFTSVTGNATFQESIQSVWTNTDERRDLNVETTGPGGLGITGSPATVYIFRLDGSTVLGPFRINYGNVLKVRIDNKFWGVEVICSTPHLISVWISSGTVEAQETGNEYLNYNTSDSWGLNNLL